MLCLYQHHLASKPNRVQQGHLRIQSSKTQNQKHITKKGQISQIRILVIPSQVFLYSVSVIVLQVWLILIKGIFCFFVCFPSLASTTMLKFLPSTASLVLGLVPIHLLKTNANSMLKTSLIFLPFSLLEFCCFIEMSQVFKLFCFFLVVGGAHGTIDYKYCDSIPGQTCHFSDTYSQLAAGDSVAFGFAAGYQCASGHYAQISQLIITADSQPQFYLTVQNQPGDGEFYPLLGTNSQTHYQGDSFSQRSTMIGQQVGTGSSTTNIFAIIRNTAGFPFYPSCTFYYQITFTCVDPCSGVVCNSGVCSNGFCGTLVVPLFTFTVLIVYYLHSCVHFIFAMSKRWNLQQQ
jgi:hypothetical protein